HGTQLTGRVRRSGGAYLSTFITPYLRCPFTASYPQEPVMWFWYVPAPDEAVLISGSKRQALDTGFRIVTGHGSFVWPVKQKARILSLALREVELAEDCITSQGIHLNVRSVAAFKIGNDEESIARAARRFLSAPTRMEEVVGQMLA